MLQGPGIAWYLGISAFLFGTGALGVLVRRNPLIILLSLEIMLNGGNLALIAFACSPKNDQSAPAKATKTLRVPIQPSTRRGIRLPPRRIRTVPASGAHRQSQAPAIMRHRGR